MRRGRRLVAVSFLSAILGLSMACGQSSHVPASWTSGQSLALQVGEAYESLRLQFTDQICVRFSELTRDGLSEKRAFLQKITDDGELAKAIGYQVSGSYAYGLAKGEAKAALLEEGRDTERSLSFVSFMRVVSKVARAMSPAIDATTSGGPRQACGDSYVSSIDFGSELTVLVKMAFASEKFKRTFSAATGGDYASLGDIRASVEALDEETKRFTSMTMRYASVGEAMSDVPSLFKGEDFLTCSLTEFAACEHLLVSIMDYQNGAFIANAVASHSVVNFELKPYPGLSLKADPAIKARRDALEQDLTRHSADLQRASALAQSVLVSADDRAELKAMAVDIAHNIGQIKDAIVACYDTPERCFDAPSLRPYATAALATRFTILDASVDAEVTGVSNCATTIWQEVKNQCAEAGKKMPGDVESIQVSYGTLQLEQTNVIFFGRSCKAAVPASHCRIKIKI